jgi:DNA polymerase-4
MSTERRIAHLDMDAFYASVELLRRPELRGRPLAIGGHGDPRSRGVVTTATYEARAFGIRSGMALRRAAELCPGCVFLPVDFDEYRRYSRRFKQAIATIAPSIEDRGIDEVYIDLDEIAAEPRTAGAAIKAAVREATGLTCSVGIAPNKLLAKIASELDKPDGLTVLGMDDLPTRIWPMPARTINGIGPRADEKLAALGIPHDRRAGRAGPSVAGRALRPQLRRVAARRGARPRRPAGGHALRAQVAQPRDHLRARPASRGRLARARLDLSKLCREVAATWRAGATRAARSASRRASTTSAS